MATYCGQNRGARQPERIKKGIWQALFITWVWGVFVIILSYTVAPYLIYLVTGTENREIIETSQKYLRVNSVFYLFQQLFQYSRNAMQGIGDHVNTNYFKWIRANWKSGSSYIFSSKFEIFWDNYIRAYCLGGYGNSFDSEDYKQSDF